jgi:hypothetical protein
MQGVIITEAYEYVKRFLMYVIRRILYCHVQQTTRKLYINMHLEDTDAHTVLQQSHTPLSYFYVRHTMTRLLGG